MKNELNYYYGIKVDNIHQKEGIYKFNIYGQDYALVPFNRDVKDIDDLYKISITLISRGIYCHQFIPNCDNQLITYINQIPYVLLQIYIKDNRNITKEDVHLFTNYATVTYKDSNLRRDNWKSLWINKIDYFEYQVSQFGKKYPLIRESFSYFIGFVETGISLLNTISMEYNNLVISHRRIQKKDTLFDLYNPINFIVDVRVRDICEYYKASFLDSKNIVNDIKNYLSTANLNTYELLMFFIRLLYPSFYFDIYEGIIENGDEEELLMKAIKVNGEYEILIKEIYIYLSNYIVMPEIEWIKKM